MLTDQHRYNKISKTIIGCSFEVANTLGRGFVEKIYANALAKEIESHSIKALREYPVKVRYKGGLVGEFFCDLLVDDQIIVETKATSNLTNLHMSQCLNYLKATGFKLCLHINFGTPSVQI